MKTCRDHLLTAYKKGISSEGVLFDRDKYRRIEEINEYGIMVYPNVWITDRNGELFKDQKAKVGDIIRDIIREKNNSNLLSIESGLFRYGVDF